MEKYRCQYSYTCLINVRDRYCPGFNFLLLSYRDPGHTISSSSADKICLKFEFLTAEVQVITYE